MSVAETPSAAASRRLDELYRRHVADVYRYAYAVLGNHADAEDVTQTTFVNALRALERGERPRRPGHWLIVIAHNLVRQRWRQAAARPTEVALLADVPAREPDEDETRLDDLVRALQRIPPAQREALVMRELEGRSYAEIAEMLGLTTAALETLLFRARRSLAEEIESLVTCERAELALSRRLDGRLGRKERRRLDDHLAGCAACSRLAGSQLRHRRAFRGLAVLPLPLGLTLFKGTTTASAGTGLGAVGTTGATGAAAGATGAAGGGLVGGAAIKVAAVVVAGTVATGAAVKGVDAVRDRPTRDAATTSQTAVGARVARDAPVTGGPAGAGVPAQAKRTSAAQVAGAAVGGDGGGARGAEQRDGGDEASPRAARGTTLGASAGTSVHTGHEVESAKRTKRTKREKTTAAKPKPVKTKTGARPTPAPPAKNQPKPSAAPAPPAQPPGEGVPASPPSDSGPATPEHAEDAGAPAEAASQSGKGGAPDADRSGR